jgi:LysM repeat protein
MLKRMLLCTALSVILGCGKQASSLDEFTRLAGTIKEKNQEIGKIDQDIRDAVHKFNTNRKADEQINLPDSLMGLNKDQLKLVQTMVDKEQDLTYRGLLSQIVEKNKQIGKLSSDLDDVKAKLPKPYVVKSGDTHFRISANFLKEKGVPQEKINQLLEETLLADELMDGFNVWLYYNDGVFGTFVTQGSVKISPNQFKRIIRKQQLDVAVSNAVKAATQKDSTAAVAPVK